MKKILFCINSLGLGGQEKQLLDLVSNLDGNYKAFILLFNKNIERKNYVKDIPKVYIFDKKINKFFKSYFYIKKLIKENNINIIFAFDLGSSVYSLFPAKLTKKIKFFAQFNGSFIGNKKLLFFLKIFYPFYKKIICNSYAGANYLKRLGIPEKKLQVINQGFNFKAMERPDISNLSLKEELNISEDIPLVGCVGKLNKDKDPITFLKAAKIVYSKLPKVNFCLIGDGEQKEMLKEFIINNQMDKYFYLVPKREDAPWLIKDFDIGILSSKNEGLPNVLLEYMYWSKPIVTTDAGDSRKVVQDGNSGFVVPKGDFEKMAEKIIYLLKNKDRAKSFGIKGREILEKEFSLEKQKEKYYKLFSE